MSTGQTVAVVGGGYMGGGIAQTFALAGHPVMLADASQELASQALGRLLHEGRSLEDRGLFPEGAARRLAENVRAVSVGEAAAGAEYITEAVPEQLELKNEVLATISAAAPRDALITSNTSAIPIADLARVVTCPERFLGAHWMNPAYFVPCVEVVATAATDPAAVDSVVTLLQEVGKTPTVVADSPGFVANRLQFALYMECIRMVEEGLARPEQVDEVVRNSFGYRLPFLGPFVMSDIAGLDVYASSLATMERNYPERFTVPELLRDHVAAGRLGVKSGRGFYQHGDQAASRLREYRDSAYWRLSQIRAELEERVDWP